MIFSPQELDKIKKQEIFTKLVNNKKCWIKPLSDYKSYPLGSIKSHEIYFKILKKYFGKHIPQTKFIKFDRRITLIVQKDIEGKKIKTLNEIGSIIRLKQNKQFKEGLRQLLKAKKWVIDLYIYKKNFIITKGKRVYYIDGRMPIFSNESEKIYKISKKRTLRILGY